MTTTTPSTGEHRFIPLSQLQPSPLNHRKHFDKAKMEELTASVTAQGVIVPVIARPLGEGFEIVAGERRYRAAKAAKLPTIPAIVRELSDAQALELQVVENNQRVDVHPLEEAEGYEALMKCAKADGTPYTADEIAAKVGKSRSYVYGRLKLTALSQNGRKALYKGLLDASRALLLARIPVPELQDKALVEILRLDSVEELDEDQDDLDTEYGPRPMSYREAAEHVQMDYTLQLKVAPFKTADAGLIPEAGPCTTCPKRSGNQPELFADIESADVCTDPKCFAAKRDAHLEQLAKAAADKGKKVVAPNARGYIRLDQPCKSDPSWRKVGEVLGKAAGVEVMQMPVADDDGKTSFVEVVKKSAVNTILADKIKAAREKAGYGGGDRTDWQLQQKIRNEYTRRLFTHILGATDAAAGAEVGLGELQLLIELALDRNADAELVAELLLPGHKGDPDAAIKKALPKLDLPSLIRLLLAVQLSTEVGDYQGEETLEAAAKRYKVDAGAIRGQVEAELRPPPEKKGKKPTAPAMAA